MDSQPELALLAKALDDHGLEAILIGNMAAALQGAPVSAIDIDLFFRLTPRNMQKLKRIATALEAVILRPYYPVLAFFRLQRESDGLQIDFLWRIDGVLSYEGVRGRADLYEIGGRRLLAASADDIILSKRAAGAAPPEREVRHQPTRPASAASQRRSAALKHESDRALIESIRYRLSLAPEKRLNCLRRKIGLRATSL